MKNGKEYRQSIHQQIIDLLDKTHLGDNERIILNKLDSGKIRIFCFFNLIFCVFE